MLVLIALFSAILALSNGQFTSVDQCVRSSGALPMNTIIEGCATPPCLLPQLQDAVIHLQFKAPYNIQRMRTLATAYLNLGLVQIPVPYDLGPNAETCNFLTNSYCPVAADEVLQYTLRMHIESFFPVGVSVTVEFRIVDDAEIPITCLRAPLLIGSPIDRAINEDA